MPDDHQPLTTTEPDHNAHSSTPLVPVESQSGSSYMYVVIVTVVVATVFIAIVAVTVISILIGHLVYKRQSCNTQQDNTGTKSLIVAAFSEGYNLSRGIPSFYGGREGPFQSV